MWTTARFTTGLSLWSRTGSCDGGVLAQRPKAGLRRARAPAVGLRRSSRSIAGRRRVSCPLAQVVAAPLSLAATASSSLIVPETHK